MGVPFRRRPSYSAADVARLLGCPRSSVARALACGELPSYRPAPGSRRRVSHGQLAGYLDAQPWTVPYRRALAGATDRPDMVPAALPIQ